MKTCSPDHIRNVGLIAHSGAGKTTLAESILYDSGQINRRGTVEEGNTVMDFDPEEIRRQVSISTSIASCEWDGHKINLIDTPGDQNFVGDALLSMGIMDAVLVIVSAVSGVKAQTEKVWEWANNHRLPRIIFINKMDNDKASYETAFGQIDAHFHPRTLKFTLPIGSGPSFSGVVDLLNMKAYIYKKDGEGTFTIDEIPDNLRKWAEKERQEMVESVAETDEALLEKYMENDTLEDADLFCGLRRAVITGEVVPVLCGSATQNIVVRKTLNTIVNFLPSPMDAAPRACQTEDGTDDILAPDPDGLPMAQVFKTVADPYAGKLSFFRVFSGSLASDSAMLNASRQGAKERIGSILAINGKKHEPIKQAVFGDIAAVAKLKTAQTGDTLSTPENLLTLRPETAPKPMISVALETESKGDEEKLSSSLHRLTEEDPTVTVHIDTNTSELILSGMGQVHLETIVSRLKEKFGLTVSIKTPKIAYREAILRSAESIGKVKKQTGGHGQFAICHLKVEPLPDGADFEFVNAIVGGVIPRQYIPAVEKGAREAMTAGALAGYPVTGCRVTVFDGKHHDVDSSEMAFKTAAAHAFRDAFLKSSPVILEPMMEMEIVVPEECVGDVMSDLSQKRGQVLGMGIMAGSQRVKAIAPLSEVLTYVKDLRSLTGGRGEFTMHFSSYEQSPEGVAKQIIKASQVGEH